MSPGSAATRDLLEAACFSLLAIGALGLAGVVRSWLLASRAAQWPVVPGVVRHASLKKGRSLPVESSSGGVNKGAVVYRALVTYAYRVDGAHFEGTRVRFGAPRRMRSKAAMADVVARYPVGTAVQVHHSPHRPADAVLELGLHPMWRKALVFSVVMTGLGLAVGAWLAAAA